MLVQLRSMGHEVCVLEESRVLGKWTSRRTADHFRDDNDGIPTLWYDPRRGVKRLLTWVPDRLFRSAFDGRNLVHRMWVILEAVRRFNPDVVVCSDGFSYGIPAALLKWIGLMPERLLVSYIGGDILDRPDAELGRRRTRMTDWLIRKSVANIDVLRPVSPMLREVLLRDGAPARKIRVCPSHLVVDSRVSDRIQAQRAAFRNAIRSLYRIAPEAPLVVTLSGNNKGKGVHILAEAWPAIVAALPNARWLLCGPEHPWLNSSVWPLLDAAGLRQTVVAAGRLEGDAVFEHLAVADLNVNPALCEGLNMVAVEAAAVGTPTITSDGAGIAYWVRSHKAGAVVAAADVSALAVAVIAAFSDPALLPAWQTVCHAFSSDFFMVRIAGELLELCAAEPAIEIYEQFAG
ncbi:MAG: glycosyltransferase family 4 protein [Betaproteobacteria bacterium]|nr:glycosyltransferase family 4 protein [Betaproteobacteria bacterium]